MADMIDRKQALAAINQFADDEDWAEDSAYRGMLLSAIRSLPASPPAGVGVDYAYRSYACDEFHKQIKEIEAASNLSTETCSYLRAAIDVDAIIDAALTSAVPAPTPIEAEYRLAAVALAELWTGNECNCLDDTDEFDRFAAAKAAYEKSVKP
jgi:hypothetical protein